MNLKVNRHGILRIIGIIFLFHSLSSYASLKVSFDKDFLDTEKHYLVHKTSEIISILPEKFKDTIQKKKVNFKKLPSLVDVKKCETTGEVWGKYSNNLLIKDEVNIWINERLINRMNQNDCPNISFDKKLSSTLIHEFSHLLDQYFKDFPWALSSNDQFLRVGNFKNTWSRSKNKNAAKSPDHYEFKSSKESFAVNMEHYLLDKNFSCKKPALSAIFDAFFDQKNNNRDCSKFKSILIFDGDIQRKVNLAEIEIYDIHYLIAGKSNTMGSNLGHSMIRVIGCSPEREIPSEECLYDTKYHYVLTFAANVNGSLELMKGLNGSYSAGFGISSFNSVVRSYNGDQGRTLESIPLSRFNRLSTDFIKSLILEKFWNYETDYYFLGRNCVTETSIFLESIYPQLKFSKRITPYGILRELVQLDIVSTNSEQRLTNDGVYYWRIPTDIMKEQYRIIESATLNFPTFNELLNLTVKERKTLYQEAINLKTELSKRKITLFFLKLEKLNSAEKLKDVYKEIDLESVGSPEVDTYIYESYGVPINKQVEVIMRSKNLGILNYFKHLLSKYPSIMKKQNELKENLNFYREQLIKS